jgi:hypothetical protein
VKLFTTLIYKKLVELMFWYEDNKQFVMPGLLILIGLLSGLIAAGVFIEIFY